MKHYITFIFLVILTYAASSQARHLEYPTYYTSVNGLSVAYQEFGDRQNDTVLLVMGLGGQLIHWPDDLVLGLVEQGYHVVRYDNRDAGWSGKLYSAITPGWLTLLKYKLGIALNAPYSLADMASDGMGLLSQLGIQKAHVVGLSMGGMIAQIMAADYPERVTTLTSIMSTSGDPNLPAGSVQPSLKDQDGLSREQIISQNAHFSTLIDGTAAPLSLEDWKRNAARSFDRAYYPDGVGRQIMAIISSGDRVELLKTLSQPTLVIHGKKDNLIPLEGGEHTAELVKNSKLILLDGMGHYIDAVNLPKVLSAISDFLNAQRRVE